MTETTPAPAPAPIQSAHPISVIVRDVEIPFWEMVGILVKLSIAAVPAMLVVWLFWMALASVAVMLFGSLLGLGGLAAGMGAQG